MNVVVKDVTQNYPVWEVVFFRAVFALPLMYPLIRLDRGYQRIQKSQFKSLLFLGLVGTFAIYCIFMSFRLLPLADATALCYSSILFVTALSQPVLKEYVGIHRWSAIIIGFIGVLIMASPKGQFNFHCLYALTFAILEAVIIMTIRLLSRQLSAKVIVFYFCLVASVISGGMMMINQWKTPTFKDFLVLAMMGFISGVAQLLLTHAYRIAPAVAVAPMSYSSLLWGMLFGIIIFDEHPTLQLGIGSAIIISACLYIIYREAVATPHRKQEDGAQFGLKQED
jgi:drug/metabolite transporter (DMT)-like permease